MSGEDFQGILGLVIFLLFWLVLKPKKKKQANGQSASTERPSRPQQRKRNSSAGKDLLGNDPEQLDLFTQTEPTFTQAEEGEETDFCHPNGRALFEVGGEGEDLCHPDGHALADDSGEGVDTEHPMGHGLPKKQDGPEAFEFDAVITDDEAEEQQERLMRLRDAIVMSEILKRPNERR